LTKMPQRKRRRHLFLLKATVSVVVERLLVPPVAFDLSTYTDKSALMSFRLDLSGVVELDTKSRLPEVIIMTSIPRRAPRSLGVFPAGWWRDVWRDPFPQRVGGLPTPCSSRTKRRPEPSRRRKRWSDSPPPRPSTSLHARTKRTPSTWPPAGGARARS
jgi:hypothetical protein